MFATVTQLLGVEDLRQGFPRPWGNVFMYTKVPGVPFLEDHGSLPFRKVVRTTPIYKPWSSAMRKGFHNPMSLGTTTIRTMVT